MEAGRPGMGVGLGAAVSKAGWLARSEESGAGGEAGGGREGWPGTERSRDSW